MNSKLLLQGQFNSIYAAQFCPLKSVSVRRRGCTRGSLDPGLRTPLLQPCRSNGPNTSSLVVDIRIPAIAPVDENETISQLAKPASNDATEPVTAQETTNESEVIQEVQPVVQPHVAAPEDRKALLMAAIKPPMYSVGFIPVLVAAAAAYAVHGVLPLGRTAGLVLAAILVIAWLNLSNDAFDAQTGVDRTKPESVVNLLGGRRTAVLLLAKSLLLAGGALLLRLVTAAPGGDPRPAGLLALSIACGYVYQGPPFRLSYKGLGEPLCFVAFGPSATAAFFLALQPDGAAAAAAAACAAAGSSTVAALTAGVAPLVWPCAVLVGLTTTAILFCSHFHQIAGDIAAGKRSPLVRLGTERARHVLRAAAVLTHGLALAAGAAGALPWPAAAATLLAAPAAAGMVAFADEHHTVPARVAPLKRYAVKWHILFGLCLCVGLAAARALRIGV